MELGEIIPETKRVNDFLAGILDARLSTGKDLILGDEQKLSSFEACQQFLKTLISNKVIQDKHERVISSAHTIIQSGHGRGRQGQFGHGGRHGGRGQPNRTIRKRDEISTRTYSPEEWAKLTPEQKKRIWELRNAKRARTDRSTSTIVSNARSYEPPKLYPVLPNVQDTTVATISTITPSSANAEAMTPTTHHVSFTPNVNFGREAHKKG
jgi:hypothetical protein